MPSPFPGMDPYLEDPALWPDVHHEIISVAREQLLASLRPKYFVQIDERLYVEDDTDTLRSIIVPDLRIREVDPNATRGSGGTALVEETGIEIDASFFPEVRESRIFIVDRELNRAVTVVEIVSPANKARGSGGHFSYNEKKQEILDSGTNLVEIDLLRTGTPLVLHPKYQPPDYLAQVWRWNGVRHRRWIWPMRLTEKLTPIPIPVRRDDRDGVLDLQKVLDTAYDRAGYDLRINYANEPNPPLSGEYKEWGKKQVADFGSRGSATG